MNIRMIGTVALAAAMVAGCQKSADSKNTANKNASDPNEVMVSVNGQKLTRGELDADVDKVLKAQSGKIPQEQIGEAKEYFGQQMANAFVMKTLLLAQAKKEGIVATDKDRTEREAEFVKANASDPKAPKSIKEFAKTSPFGEKRAMQEFEDGIVIEKLLKKEVFDLVKVDSADVQKIVTGIESNNTVAVKKDAAAKAKIAALKNQLENGADFAELAKANSEDPGSKDRGGELAPFTKGQMVPEFEQAAFTLPVDKVSEPVRTDYGYHLIKVAKKIPAVAAKGDAPAEPEKVQASHILILAPKAEPVPPAEQIESYLKRQTEQKALRAYFDQVREGAKIEAPGFPALAPQSKAEPRPVAAVKPAAKAEPAAIKPVAAKTAKPAVKTDKKAAKKATK